MKKSLLRCSIFVVNNHILLQVGKVSHYDGDIVVLMPVPEYPIFSDKMVEDTPDDSLYQEDGSLEVVKAFRCKFDPFTFYL